MTTDERIDQLTKRFDAFLTAFEGNSKYGGIGLPRRVGKNESTLEAHERHMVKIDKRFDKIYNRIIGICIAISVGLSIAGWFVGQAVTPEPALGAPQTIQVQPFSTNVQPATPLDSLIVK